ncbi:MAG: hypothetical protein HBSAPP02_05730 [Phycisphaerae bacterium]|nr:MAG: hypothetical protein HBSAPP02_05730 [Phycisphaerae bacterium]
MQPADQWIAGKITSEAVKSSKVDAVYPYASSQKSRSREQSTIDDETPADSIACAIGSLNQLTELT